MSFYSMICGQHALAGSLLGAFDLEELDFARFRDVGLDPDGSHLNVFARVGGGNREEYQRVFTELREHPLFVSESDDDYDNTYCTFRFRAPDNADTRALLKRIADDPAIDNRLPSAKLKQAAKLIADEKLVDGVDQIINRIMSHMEGEPCESQVTKAGEGESEIHEHQGTDENAPAIRWDATKETQ